MSRIKEQEMHTTSKCLATLVSVLFALAISPLAFVPATGVAASLALSEGALVINVRTSRFLPATATVDWCVSARVGQSVNDDYVENGNSGPGIGVPCKSVFFIKNEARSAESFFFNFYDRRVFRGIGPAAAIAKFPPCRRL
ncbi:MAG: hypothetical protein ACREUA_08955 [Burkholderiales bacterium]